jgi:5'-phosphate synthase pdxT subunit
MMLDQGKHDQNGALTTFDWPITRSVRKGVSRSHLYNHSMPQATPLTIGVLALQGAYDAHARVLTALGATPRLVRTEIDGLIIPGGESTTILKFLERDNFFDTLADFVHAKPTFGTCAGAILLARDVAGSAQKSLNALDITVERNAYGRQNESTILSEVTALPGAPLEMVFIRAPRIVRLGLGIETLATRDGDPVLIRSGGLLAATFHPELSGDPRIHQLFLDMVSDAVLDASRKTVRA